VWACLSRGAWKQACPVLRGPGHGNMTRLPDQFRAIATRHAKRVTYYRSEIIIAAIVLWLRADLQDTPPFAEENDTKAGLCH
ncbi:hypothetical protein ACFV6Z_14750, partial [Streptomyces sp. NPDC059818]